MTFAATANAIVYTGAEPVFIDSDETGNMNPGLLELALSDLAQAGEPAKASCPSTYSARCRITVGSTCWPRSTAFRCSRTPPSRWGVPMGPCGRHPSDAQRSLSFNGNKIMTTSGGGALLDRRHRHSQARPHLATQARQPVAHYEHTEIGYNYRLSNILAALGRAQLERLGSMIERRASLRRHYIELFGRSLG